MRRRLWSRLGTCVLAVVVVAAAAGCKPPPFRSTQQTWTVGTVTRDGLDRYTYVDTGAGLQVSAPASNRGSNLRMAAVKLGTVTSVDQTSCVTWHGPANSTTQPGVVVRARLEATRTRAILVSNNIWAGARAGINVHLVDSNGSPAYTKVGSLDMTSALGHPQRLNPLPWRLCARVAGRTLTVKTWSTALQPIEPTWTDPTYAASIELPASAVVAGKPGVYIGHVQPGQTTVLSNHTRSN